MAGHDSGTTPSLGQAEALGLLRALPHGLAVLDEDGRLVFANEACARLLAWSSGAALVGHSWHELVDAPQAATLEGDLHRRIDDLSREIHAVLDRARGSMRKLCRDPY
jgi:PAS domain-containing protein